MTSRLLLTLVLPLCLVTVTLADDKADPKDKAEVAKADLKDLETGSWKVTGFNQSGADLPKELIEKLELKFTFKGDKVTITSAGDTKEGTFKIDPAKTPKEIEVKIDKDPGMGIYEITKDTLKIAFGKPDRPKDFKGGATAIVFTLERMKDAKKEDKKDEKKDK